MQIRTLLQQKVSFFYTPVYDMMSAKEKQATRSGICFSSAINEQTPDEIGQEARQRAFASVQAA